MKAKNSDAGRTFLQQHKYSILAGVLFGILALIMGLSQLEQSQNDTFWVTRGSEGSGIEQKTFTYESHGGKEYDVEIEVHELQRSGKEVRELLEKTVSEWETQYLGENKSADAVYRNLVLPSSMQSDLVQIAYETDPGDILLEDGTVVLQNVPKSGQIVRLTAVFSCQEYERTEMRDLQIVRPPEGSDAWLQLQVKRLLQQKEEHTRTKQMFQLPQEVGGTVIAWKKTSDKGWLWMLMLGAVAVLGLEWKRKEQLQRVQKIRMEALRREYPRLVEQMALLIGAGLTIRKVWERILYIARMPSKKGATVSGIYLQEMQITFMEMQKGCGEKEAYARFGKRIGEESYRRFAAILNRNLEKGTHDICRLLSAEAQEAWEQRKSDARKMGEEASMKLLFPMLSLFVLILIILLFPAVFQMQ